MKIAPTESQALRRRARTEPAILFLVAQQCFAIAASAIHEIRSTDSLSAAASEISLEGIAKVHHRLCRGRKFYYVVSACEHFSLPPSRPTLVLVLRNARVALLVDLIDRMETISLMALPPSFSGPERAWYRGMTLIGEKAVPVLNPSGILTEQEIAQLDALDVSPDNSLQSEADPLRSEAQGAVLR